MSAWRFSPSGPPAPRPGPTEGPPPRRAGGTPGGPDGAYGGAGCHGLSRSERPCVAPRAKGFPRPAEHAAGRSAYRPPLRMAPASRGQWHPADQGASRVRPTRRPSRPRPAGAKECSPGRRGPKPRRIAAWRPRQPRETNRPPKPPAPQGRQMPAFPLPPVRDPQSLIPLPSLLPARSRSRLARGGAPVLAPGSRFPVPSSWFPVPFPLSPVPSPSSPFPSPYSFLPRGA